jgi:6,7-dimethyl-8-ribityllumazine synthase
MMRVGKVVQSQGVLEVNIAYQKPVVFAVWAFDGHEKARACEGGKKNADVMVSL